MSAVTIVVIDVDQGTRPLQTCWDGPLQLHAQLFTYGHIEHARLNVCVLPVCPQQVGPTQHIMLSPEWLQYINHSCDPNVFFDTASFKLIALKDIAAGDELCFFYPRCGMWHLQLALACLRTGTPATHVTHANGMQTCAQQCSGKPHMPRYNVVSCHNHAENNSTTWRPQDACYKGLSSLA